MVALIALVASHHNRDLAVVEQLSVGAPSLLSGMVAREPAIAGAVVLPTCNRFEVYLDTADPEAARLAVIETLLHSTALPATVIAAALATYEGDDAVHHLMSVASGLESMVVGEREISGQVRKAFTDAQASGCVSPALDRAFQASLRTARLVAAQTGLGTSGQSVVSVAFDIASTTVTWEGSRAVVIGTGALAHTGVLSLRSRGATIAGAVSPSGRAEGFCATHGIEALTLEELPEAVREADVIYACSGGEALVLTPALVATARARATHPLTIIDLALHRDAAPGVAELNDVHVVSLADVAVHAPDESVEAIEQARTLVAQAVARFGSGESARALDPAVVALREHVFGLLERELAKIRPAPGADAQTIAHAEATEVALRRFAKTLLHTPTIRARERAQAGDATEDYVAAISTLFGIEVSSLSPENRSARIV